jgi:hypothetical protein
VFADIENPAQLRTATDRRAVWGNQQFSHKKSIDITDMSLLRSGHKRSRDEQEDTSGERRDVTRGVLPSTYGRNALSTLNMSSSLAVSQDDAADIMTLLLRAGQDPRAQPQGPTWRLPNTQSAAGEGACTCVSICDELLKHALGKSELADVRFHVGGAWVASGHRSVLGARSAVFARMFANETEERTSGVVRLDDVTAEGLFTFLQFVYLGTVPAARLISYAFLATLLWSNEN